MNLVPLADLELRYTSLASVGYGPGGQLYGTMEGWLKGEELRGQLQLTNLASMRPDNVNLPTLRGLLTTDDGASIYVEINGIATLRTADQARVFVTSMTFRTGEPRYAWLNTLFGLLEGVLDSVTVGGLALGRVYRCEPTIRMPEPGPD